MLSESWPVTIGIIAPKTMSTCKAGSSGLPLREHGGEVFFDLYTTTSPDTFADDCRRVLGIDLTNLIDGIGVTSKGRSEMRRLRIRFGM